MEISVGIKEALGSRHEASSYLSHENLSYVTWNVLNQSLQLVVSKDSSKILLPCGPSVLGEFIAMLVGLQARCHL